MARAIRCRITEADMHRVILVLMLLFGATQDTSSPTFRCWEMCEVLDMQYVATEGCRCRCKDVDGSEYDGAIPDCT